MFAEVRSIDFLGFNDLKPYKKRLNEAYEKTGLHDSITAAHGKVNGQDLVVCCMDFNFIGGSLGSVMGEKIARSADYCLKHRIPFMIISKSGGARIITFVYIQDETVYLLSIYDKSDKENISDKELRDLIQSLSLE